MYWNVFLYILLFILCIGFFLFIYSCYLHCLDFIYLCLTSIILVFVLIILFYSCAYMYMCQYFCFFFGLFVLIIVMCMVWFYCFIFCICMSMYVCSNKDIFCFAFICLHVFIWNEHVCCTHSHMSTCLDGWIDWFCLAIFPTNLVRGLSSKEMNFQNKGAVPVWIDPILFIQLRNQNQSIRYGQRCGQRTHILEREEHTKFNIFYTNMVCVYS